MLAAKPQPSVVAPGASGPSLLVAEAMETAGYFTVAPVYNAELLPNCAGPKATDNCADASLEEVSFVDKFYFPCFQYMPIQT